MPITTAKKDAGFCPCGTLIEGGEQIETINGRSVHVGCKPQKVESSAAPQTQTSGFLFSEMESRTIETTKQTVGASYVSFDGPSAMQIDTPRLAGQLARVFQLMRDGKFRDLTDIASKTGCLETSASSRLRDFRKARFGGHTVVSRQVVGSPGTHEYKLVLRKRNESDGQRNAA